MGLFDSTLKIIRRWFFGMSDPTPTVFPVRAPETVFVQSLAEHDPFKLSKFSLTKSSLSRTDGVHEKLSLCFKEDGQNALYGLVADRTQPSRAVRANERQSLSRSSSDASVQVWDSRKEKDVNDCVRGFYPPAGNRWWASGSESDVFVADLHTTPTTRQHLTLLDVALVLRSVSDHKPHYVLVQENCWWFARCAGLLLEILAAEPTTQTTEALATDFFKRAPLPQLPFGIPASNLIDTERIICRDVREIRKLFNTYVRQPCISCRQIEIASLISGAIAARNCTTAFRGERASAKFRTEGSKRGCRACARRDQAGDGCYGRASSCDE